MPIKHEFISEIADGEDVSVVRPSNWNDDHDGMNIHDHSGDLKGGRLSFVFPSDVPPETAHADDDEFTGSVIDAAWSSVNLSTVATYTPNNYGLLGEIGADDTQLRGLMKPCPTGDFIISLGVHDYINKGTGAASTWSGFGLVISAGSGDAVNSAAVAAIMFNTNIDDTFNGTIANQIYSAFGTRTSNVAIAGYLLAPSYIYLKAYYTTSWRYEIGVSRSGMLWDVTWTNQAVGFTPTRMGLSLYDRTASGNKTLIRWFRVEEL